MSYLVSVGAADERDELGPEVRAEVDDVGVGVALLPERLHHRQQLQFLVLLRHLSVLVRLPVEERRQVGRDGRRLEPRALSPQTDAAAPVQPVMLLMMVVVAVVPLWFVGHLQIDFRE